MLQPLAQEPPTHVWPRVPQSVVSTQTPFEQVCILLSLHFNLPSAQVPVQAPVLEQVWP